MNEKYTSPQTRPSSVPGATWADACRSQSPCLRPRCKPGWKELGRASPEDGFARATPLKRTRGAGRGSAGDARGFCPLLSPPPPLHPGPAPEAVTSRVEKTRAWTWSGPRSTIWKSGPSRLRSAASRCSPARVSCRREPVLPCGRPPGAASGALNAPGPGRTAASQRGLLGRRGGAAAGRVRACAVPGLRRTPPFSCVYVTDPSTNKMQ